MSGAALASWASAAGAEMCREVEWLRPHATGTKDRTNGSRTDALEKPYGSTYRVYSGDVGGAFSQESPWS